MLPRDLALRLKLYAFDARKPAAVVVRELLERELPDEAPAKKGKAR